MAGLAKGLRKCRESGGVVCVHEEALSRARSAAGRLCSAREELTRLTR